MVDELTQESFQTGKAIVTVSVDLITAIADACKRSEQQNPGMSEEQKETLLGKVVDKVMSNYKETHGSLKGFNREGKDVTHIDVNDERTAELLEKACILLDYTSFLTSGVSALKVVIIAVGGGLAVLGVVNLLEGYGNDNPGAKSQGMKQFMAGAGVMLIGALLVPKLKDLIPATLS